MLNVIEKEEGVVVLYLEGCICIDRNLTLNITLNPDLKPGSTLTLPTNPNSKIKDLTQVRWLAF